MSCIPEVSQESNDPKNFYCSNGSSARENSWSSCVLRLRRSYMKHKTKPLPAVFKSRLDGPSVTWKICRRLHEAVCFADSNTKDCMVFSFEERIPESKGQRLFLVAHPQHMWLNHKSRRLDERCSYEVIREGFPCKLYFDLEFQKICNPSKDGEKMTKIFIKCIIAALLDQYSLKYEVSDVLWLDASTEKKFSCHLILQMKDIVFEDNLQVGIFVSELLSNIQKKMETNVKAVDLWPSADELKSLFVQTTNEKTTLFCDQGVYTKNRNFRMYLSTKFGKKAPLLLSKQNQYTLPISEKSIDELIFYDSLVTYFRERKHFTRFLKATEQVMARLFHSTSTCGNKKPGNLGCDMTSFPEIYNFILHIIRDNSVVGFIRKWTYLSNENLIVYEIGNYRFCSNIGRHHKSNNIMIIVDMKKKIYYQKCHDPECRAQGYKSEIKDLPENILDSYCLPDDFFDDDFSEMKILDEHICSMETKTAASQYDISVKERNVNEDYLIDNSFFEDTSFDFDYFFQSNESDRLNQKRFCENKRVEEKKFQDAFIEDYCMDVDLESSNLKTAPRSPLKKSNCSNFWDEKAVTECCSKSSRIPTEDELIMAESASVIEAIMDREAILEETVF